MKVYILNKDWHGDEVEIMGVFLNKEIAEKEMKKWHAKEKCVWIDEHEVIERI